MFCVSGMFVHPSDTTKLMRGNTVKKSIYYRLLTVDCRSLAID